MKKIKRAAWLLMAACMAACPTLQGQTFNNFVQGCITNSASRSVIRGYSATEAVVYYEHGTDHILALVNSVGQVCEACLNPGYAVYDIRLAGDMAYFCGKNAGHGFIGVVKINDLRSPSPNVQYYDLDPDMVSELTRMVAYQMGGVTKVAAIGQLHYSFGDSVDSLFPPCTSHCQASVVVECDISGGAMTSSNLLVLDSPGSYETAFDIVETDHYVAVLTRYITTAVYRCDKANVLGTFNLNAYRCYSSPYVEDLEGCRACRTMGDTIAVVGMASVTGSAPCEIHMRLFDLQSMQMTSYQGYGIFEKSTYSDVVYMPQYATLVMLQNHPFPSTAYSYPFVYWKPHEASAYNARVMLLAHPDVPYLSLDRLTGSYYVATGGDYWFMKDVAFDDPASMCYKIFNIKINILPPPRYDRFFPTYGTLLLNPSRSGGAIWRPNSALLKCITN